MPETVSDRVVEILTEWGVDTVFGLPGDGINGLVEAFRKAADKIRYVHVRHEETAALATCAYSKFSGRLGVCFSTAAPGAVHLLNGLYDAKIDGAAVLAITGMTYHDLVGTHYLQDINQDYLFQDVALYNQRLMGPEHVENVLNLACRTALSNRAVAHVAIPIDYQAGWVQLPISDEARCGALGYASGGGNCDGARDWRQFAQAGARGTLSRTGGEAGRRRSAGNRRCRRGHRRTVGFGKSRPFSTPSLVKTVILVAPMTLGWRGAVARHCQALRRHCLDALYAHFWRFALANKKFFTADKADDVRRFTQMLRRGLRAVSCERCRGTSYCANSQLGTALVGWSISPRFWQAAFLF